MAEDTKQLKKIEEFVKNLEGSVREITKEYITIPNVPDCSIEVLSFMLRHEETYQEVAKSIQDLMQKTRTDYDFIQEQLIKRLYTSEEKERIYKRIEDRKNNF